VSFLNRRRRPQPHEVFTPGSLPLEHHNIYVHRFGAEESLSRFIKRQQVPVVFGGYGVGKTTLVKKYFQDDASANRLVYIAADPSLTMTDFFAVILESLHYTVETETVEKKSTKNDGGFDTRVLKATHGRQRDTEKRSSLFVKSPTDVGILEIIDEARLTIVIDEMHKCSPMFRQELADFIKGVKTHGSTNTRLVLVGTTADAERLVAADPGIDRYLKELEVPLLLPTEALSLVREGLARLGIEITDGLCTRVIDLAAGAPTIIHAIALEIAESTLARQDVVVTESDCIIAVRRY